MRTTTTAVVIFMIQLCSGFASNGATAESITSFKQLGAVPEERAAKGLAAKIRAVVLCYDSGWGQLYFNDGTETRWMSPLLFKNKFEAGDQVEIFGATHVADGSVSLTNLQVRALGHQDLPPALQLPVPELFKGFGDWVEISGQVRVADASSGRLGLVLEDRGRRCLVYVMGAPPQVGIKSYIGSTISVRGINASKVDNGKLVKASLFAPDLKEVRVLKPAQFRLETIPVSPIEKLLSQELGPWTNEFLHVNGLVSAYRPGVSISVKDPTGILQAEVVQMTRALPDQRVDLWGVPALDSDGLVLRDGYFEIADLARSKQNQPGSGFAAVSTNSSIALTNVAEVLRSTAQAGTRLPVCLRGTITFADPDWHNVFFRDSTGEVYVDSDQTNLVAGQWVELRGQTAPGGFAPQITALKIDVLGTTNLPAPARVDLADLADGQFDGHWVQLEGVVRRAGLEWSHLDLNIMTSKGKFRAIIPNPTDPGAGPKLVGCLVQVQGACGAQLNSRGQLSGITLHVPSLAQIQIVEGAPADPFSVRTTPIESLAMFDPARRAGGRVKVSGTVLLVLPQRGFYLHDGTGGVRVQTQETSGVKAGEAVDVLGFVAMGEVTPYLEDALLRHAGQGKFPQPKQATADQILASGAVDGDLVEVVADLVQDVPRSARPKLVLREGNILFVATVEGVVPENQVARWQSGSLVRARGVCSIQGDEAHEPQGFKLLVRRVQDIVVLKSPPWWSMRQILILVGILLAAMAAAAGWISLLRSQVRAQTIRVYESQKELVKISRHAGMAEVATSVLHNVGNVLNSINVSVTLLDEHIRKSRTSDLKRVVNLLDENASDLGGFFTRDPRAAKIPHFLDRLADRLGKEQATLLTELTAVRENVAHVKDIVAMQQSYAKVSGAVEMVAVMDLVEDTLRMNAGALARHGVKVVRDYTTVPPISTDKHKVLQILVNLVRNAKYACDEAGREEKEVTVSVTNGGDLVRIAVIDNGVGIRPENLTRIFNHGFTTRKEGHGFGLHSGALAAKELGGSLTAQSDGPDRGATFILALPKTSPSPPKSTES